MRFVSNHLMQRSMAFRSRLGGLYMVIGLIELSPTLSSQVKTSLRVFEKYVCGPASPSVGIHLNTTGADRNSAT